MCKLSTYARIKKEKMKRNQAEHRIQVAFVKAARMYCNGTGVLIYANQNESYGSTRADMIRGMRLKEQGRLSGIPDVFISWPRLGFHGLYIEFKRDKPNKTYLKPHQREIIEQLRDKGYCVAVCRSAADAMELLNRYAIGSDPDDVMKDHNWK